MYKNHYNIKTKIAVAIIIIVIIFVGAVVLFLGKNGIMSMQQKGAVKEEKRAVRENSQIVQYKNEKYGFLLEIPVSWKIEEGIVRDFQNINFIDGTVNKISLLVASPETFSKILFYCSLWRKYQYSPDGASKDELVDAQLCQSLLYKDFADNFIARNKNYYFSYEFNLDNDARDVLNSFKIINDRVGWKNYRNNEYGFEFQYPDTFSLLSVDKIDDYGSLKVNFSTLDVLYDSNGIYSPFQVIIYSPEDFQKQKLYCKSDKALPLECVKFPITDDDDRNYNLQKNNKYYIYLADTWWQEYGPVDWMTNTEFNWVQNSFKVFDVK